MPPSDSEPRRKSPELEGGDNLTVGRRGFIAGAGAIAASVPNIGHGAHAAQDPQQANDGAESTQNQSSPRYVPDEPLPDDREDPQEALDALGISGYPSQMTVKPGDTVQIMASTKEPAFEATMVRIVHGDADPRGPGVQEEVIDTPVNGTYNGANQRLPLGSYVEIPDARHLRADGSFTVTAWIAPTTIPGSPFNRIAIPRSPVGSPRMQGLISKWSENDNRGYCLCIDEQGSIALRIGNGRNVETISTGVTLRPWAPGQGGGEAFFRHSPRPQHVNRSGWYFVAASYDAQTGDAVVLQQSESTLPDDSTKTSQATLGRNGVRDSRTSLLMAAYWNASGDNHPVGFFNGKIESPRYYDRAFDEDDLKHLATGSDVDHPVAAWDFYEKMSTDDIIDSGSHQLHGHAINLPVRALTSHNWDRTTMSYHEDPSQWGSVYFHEDDLGDAGWSPAFNYKVPANARSGTYAARLKANGNTYHVVFVVRPSAPQSSIAMLVPTFSYLAYGSTGGSLSQYSYHSDGSGYVYSSALRPLEDVRPYETGYKGEGRPWQFEADTHIFHWLEVRGYDVDYITDHDLHREGQDLLESYSTVITGSHPEYISTKEMDALKGWLEGGGRMIYMGGNGFYWVTALSDDGTYTELRRHDGTQAWHGAPGEHYHSTDGEFGGLWRFRGRPPQELVGVGFGAQGFGYRGGSADYNVPLDRTEASYSPEASWIFEGVSRETGIGGDMPTLQAEGGPMGEEVDRVDYSLGTPANAIVVGVSRQFGDEYMRVVEEVNTSSLFQGGSRNPMVRGDVTIIYYPNGGAVFSTSSMVWSGGFFHNNYQNDMTRITENVLDKFVSDEPVPGHPETA